MISSIQLVRAGISCTVIEKKSYPFHRVCGEYVSNEALPFLKDSGLYPEHLKLSQVKSFEFSSVSGQSFSLPLDLGGFGISRYAFDNFLYRMARKEGVSFQLNTEVTAVSFSRDEFDVRTTEGGLSADLVLGCFGKRSKIDVQQQRDFIKKRSPYVGVKYHVLTEHPAGVIALHNFPGGYCGICRVEDGITNLCYLTHVDNLKASGDIALMEKEVLFKNPRIRNVFMNSSFVFSRPEVINEISFDTKEPVENHMLMAGDAAGMITPVCGNGMAIAIHSGKILGDLVISYSKNRINRETLESRYRSAWNSAFRTRLWFGRSVHRLFVHPYSFSLVLTLSRRSRLLANFLVSKTHGRPF